MVDRDWTPAEDLRPGIAFAKTQPEVTARGNVWTQIICFHWPCRGYTQMTIRDVNGDYLIGHGRVYPMPPHEEEGAWR